MAYEVFIWTYFLCCTLIFFVIAFLDAKYFYISDLCLICLAIFAILKCIFLSQNEKLLLELCLSFTVTFLLFASVYRFCGGLGFGDVKYSCVLSLHFNLLKSLELFLFSTIFAIFYSVFLLKKELSTIDNRSIKIPYGTFLSIGAILFLSFSLCLPCTAQNVNEKEIQLEFFNQKNSDILKTLSSFCEKTLNYDETITGSSSFSFYDDDFESALSHFCKYNDFYWKKDGEIYFVSKIFVKTCEQTEKSETGLSEKQKFTVHAQECSPLAVINSISRESGVSIMADSFPTGTISIHKENAVLSEILEIFSLRFEGIEVNFENGIYFLKNKTVLNTKRNDFRFSLREKNGNFSLQIERANLSSVLYELFKKSKKEFAFFCKTDPTLENLKVEEKSFEQILNILMLSSSCVFVEKDGVFFILDSKQKDFISEIRQIYVVNLSYIKTSEIMNIFPSELNVSSFVKQDKTRNRLFVTGTKTELDPILDFIQKVDKKHENLYYAKFNLELTSNESVEKVISSIPQDILFSEIIYINGSKSFVTLVNAEKEREVQKFLSFFSTETKMYSIKLKYIDSDELIKFAPTNINTSCIQKTPDENVVIFTGTKNEYEQLLEYINFVDVQKNQIRYQLLVVQYQKSVSKNLGLDTSLVGNNSLESGNHSFIANIANLFNIDFDVVSNLGLQTAINLNSELAENRAKILADTTLNGISGNEINFENKNIFRYRDIITDPTSSATYSSVVKEISTGLVIKINGNVSGNEMISVKVNANISKQGSSSSESHLPSTSEKNVSTFVQTQSSKPIIISALLQNESDSTKNKFPLFEKIPGLEKIYTSKNASSSLSEFVIYLTPFLEKTETSFLSEKETVRRFYEKYVAE